MNSRAIKDYFRAFKVKELIVAETIIIYIYLLVGPFYFLRPEDGDVVNAALWIYYCGAAPLLLGMTGMRLNPVGMPKLMFLCPMSRKQREDYVRTRFWARFAMPALMFVIARVILWIVYPQQPFYVLMDAMFLMGLLGASFMTLTGNVKAMEATKNQPKLLREEEMKGVDMKGLLSFLIGVLTWFVSSAGIADGGKIHIAVWFMVLAVFAWQLWLTVKMLRHVKYLIPLASDYERMNVGC
ncbi:MAG: hypothetical protein E7289_09130 [Lachnospiraceae bacterium]|nr:hypothetical protein [Lachnospiraceae bacterium]